MSRDQEYSEESRSRGRAERDFTLAPNEQLAVQDTTKGSIEVHVGPFTGQMKPTEKPLLYSDGKFNPVDDIDRATQRFPNASEGF